MDQILVADRTPPPANRPTGSGRSDNEERTRYALSLHSLPSRRTGSRTRQKSPKTLLSTPRTLDPHAPPRHNQPRQCEFADYRPTYDTTPLPHEPPFRIPWRRVSCSGRPQRYTEGPRTPQ